MGRYGVLWLAAGLSAGCSSADRDGDDDAATVDAVAPSSGRPESGAEPRTGADAASYGGADDSGSASATDAASSNARDSGSLPASCTAHGAGTTTCGANGESCCTSLEVTGGTYDRTYTSSGDAAADEAAPATVTGFRLDEYEVTVGRFRQFVSAWNGGAGYVPPAGSGRHAHLNGGLGLASDGGDAGIAYETGWLSSDNGAIAPTDASLACESQFATWTTRAGGNENLPINCVNWYEAYAFCIWDGGFLPSEAESEYAAAGGSQQREYPWGGAAPHRR
jgi:sulfatase modifying factor 1